jgi:hypothetical protein
VRLPISPHPLYFGVAKIDDGIKFAKFLGNFFSKNFILLLQKKKKSILNIYGDD